MSYKVESKITVPPKSKFPFNDMKKGDSFLEADANKLNSLRVQAVVFSKATGGKIKFSIRKVDDGYRCFRIL